MLPSLGTQPVRVFHGSADKGTFDDKMMGLKYMEVVTPYSFKRFSGSPYQNSQLSVFNPLAVGNNWDDESSSTAIAVGFSLTRSKKAHFKAWHVRLAILLTERICRRPTGEPRNRGPSRGPYFGAN